MPGRGARRRPAAGVAGGGRSKAWMDTGGFAMYIETVLAPWWLKEQTSWTAPDLFPAKRIL